MTTTKDPKRKQDRAITFLTQEEMQRLFSAIKTNRDGAIFRVAYRCGLIGRLSRLALKMRGYGSPRGGILPENEAEFGFLWL